MTTISGEKGRLLASRAIGLITVALGLNYILWRWFASLNLDALWFSIAMAVAETYGIIAMILFVLMMWRKETRASLPPPPTARVDVFITTYNEPLPLLRMTVKAAMGIEWKEKKVYLLDDGARPEMRALTEELGCLYISRGAEWNHKPRHAKAGNVNNALLQTSGDFILILDADQIPAPGILERTLGYFSDERVAFVQTPQYFYNLPPGDPFGNDASLFYGPIQQGKDGWNAAFFCGSNAVLRREALMQLGLTEYVKDMEAREREGLDRLERGLREAKCDDVTTCTAMSRLMDGLKQARSALDRAEPLSTVSDIVNKAVSEAELFVSARDMSEIATSMRELSASGDAEALAVYRHIVGNIEDLAAKTAPTTVEALGVSRENLEKLNLTRADEALPIQALATISITEDMATAMRLHAMGWKSVFHPEILAYGLAPEDLGTSLKQRLRWAQGTIQVLRRDNPLFKKGLSLGQRLMYFSTMYSYFNGFFNLVLLLAPVIFFFTRISPLASWSWDFFLRFLPFFLMNKLMFKFQGPGIRMRRGEQYDLAMFPISILAVLSVYSGKKLNFVVTKKERQSGVKLGLIWPQLTVIGLSFVALCFGAVMYFLGKGLESLSFFVNAFWSCYNMANLSIVVWAVFYKTPAGSKAQVPNFGAEGKKAE